MHVLKDSYEKTGIKDSQHPHSCTSHNLNQHLSAFSYEQLYSPALNMQLLISKEYICGTHLENMNQVSQLYGKNQVTYHTWAM